MNVFSPSASAPQIPLLLEEPTLKMWAAVTYRHSCEKAGSALETQRKMPPAAEKLQLSWLLCLPSSCCFRPLGSSISAGKGRNINHMFWSSEWASWLWFIKYSHLLLLMCMTMYAVFWTFTIIQSIPDLYLVMCNSVRCICFWFFRNISAFSAAEGSNRMTKSHEDLGLGVAKM